MKLKKREDVLDGEWHWWFAWFPVELENGERVWWEDVWRRRECGNDDLYYGCWWVYSQDEKVDAYMKTKGWVRNR